jgi:glutamate racemase
MSAVNSRPIGIFDSGLGGLSVLREVRRQLPHEHVLYFADQGRLPYGPRPIEEVRQFAGQITRFLLGRDAEVIVVACNTASAAALADLRKTFPHAPFVGMEPAVKPAAEQTQSRIVGVIATEATCQSEVFASVVERFANGVTVLTRACPGLVAQVEAGDFNTPATRQLLHEYLDPMLAAGIDSLVLGCTHFPFLTPAITEIVGPNVRVVDPAPAVARQVGRLINQRRPMASASTTGPGSLTAFTTGNPPAPSELASQMIGEPIRFQTLDVSFLASQT